MKTICVAAAAVLASSILTPDLFADGRTPGSALVFPFLRRISIVSVTNTNTELAIPGRSFGGSTNVHYEYMNVIEGADPFNPASCRRSDTIEFLTPGDTRSVLTMCHAGVSPQEKGGYLVVSAQDTAVFGKAWDFDYLVGLAMVFDASGYIQVLNAIPFESLVGAGECADLNGNGRVDFDGREYEAISDVLYADSVIPCGPPSRLTLVNLTGGPRECNTIALSIWNDMEVPLSATQKFRCWFDQPLELVTPLFQFHFLARLPNDPSEMDWDCDGKGDIDTGWFMIDSIDVSTAGGFPYDDDGAVLGAISPFFGTHLLWESVAKQSNGVAFTP